ncbi:MAG: hypothetical protein GQ534_04175 [Candidatus Delongbacteria bacterium]|nr:hypothetical protein [Candidatus Delongbacteria bacterium]
MRKFSTYIFVVILLLSLTLKGEANHKVPLFLSVVIPGGGQIYNQKYLKAGIYIAAESIFIYGAIIQDQRLNDARDDLREIQLDSTQPTGSYEFLIDRYKKERNNFIWLSIGTILLSAGDAYVDSYFSECKRDIITKGDKLSVAPTYCGLAFTYTW